MISSQTQSQKKTLWATFIGAPNAGKSTLLNSLVGTKISIVTSKAQTTRTSLKGIITKRDTQLVLIDTPGIFKHIGSRISKLMVDCAWNSLTDADEIFLIIDCTKSREQENMRVLKELKAKGVSCNLILNKVDLIKKNALLDISKTLNKELNFKNTFMISALKQKGLKGIIDFLVKSARTGSWFFGEDDITTAPLRFMASEIVREKLFIYTYEEIPYNLEVEIESWEDKKDITVISVVIFVKNQGHKGIIIGHRGELLKKIGTKARTDLETLLEKRVYLNIYVKVSNWDKKILSQGLTQF